MEGLVAEHGRRIKMSLNTVAIVILGIGDRF